MVESLLPIGTASWHLSKCALLNDMLMNSSISSSIPVSGTSFSEKGIHQGAFFVYYAPFPLHLPVLPQLC
jgi:hypothetical protein